MARTGPPITAGSPARPLLLLAVSAVLVAVAVANLWLWLREPGPAIDGAWVLVPAAPVAGRPVPEPSPAAWPFGHEITIRGGHLAGVDGHGADLRVESHGGEHAIAWQDGEWHRCFVGGEPPRLVIVLGLQQLVFSRR